MKKHLRSLLIILVVFLACTTLFGCSGKRYYQYTGASMNTYEGLVTTLKQEVEEGDVFVLQSPASTIREEKDGSATKFVGWKIKGEDKIYSPGEQLTMGSKNIHLQAVWKNISFFEVVIVSLPSIYYFPSNS